MGKAEEEQGGLGPIMEQEAFAKAKKDAADAVAQVFIILCGKSDQNDKFTGMQREMNLTMQKVVESAVKSGQEIGTRLLAREQFRWKKQGEQQLETLRQETRADIEMRAKACNDRIQSMCDRLEADAEEFRQHRKTFEESTRALQDQVQQKQKEIEGLKLANQDSIKKAADLEAELHQAKEKCLDLERSMLQSRGNSTRRVQELEANYAQLQIKWNSDVTMMQRQIQTEISARVSAEERERDALERLNNQNSVGDAATLEENASLIAAKEEIANLQTHVTRLQEKVIRLERLRSEDDLKHQKQIQQMQERGAEMLASERDGRAFAEKVAKRLEHELVQQSRVMLKRNASQGSTSSAKNKFRSNHMEFQNFADAYDRLLGTEESKKIREALPPMRPADLHTASVPHSDVSAATSKGNHAQDSESGHTLLRSSSGTTHYPTPPVIKPNTSAGQAMRLNLANIDGTQSSSSMTERSKRGSSRSLTGSRAMHTAR